MGEMVENGKFNLKSMIRINFQFNIKTSEMSFVRKNKNWRIGWKRKIQSKEHDTN